MAAHEIVNVPIVRHALVTTRGPMDVPLLMTVAAMVWGTQRLVCTAGIHGVLVDVIPVHVMEMTVVEIVRMVPVAHRRVAARRAVHVGMPFVFRA
jgi:hypothetical protein